MYPDLTIYYVARHPDMPANAVWLVQNASGSWAFGFHDSEIAPASDGWVGSGERQNWVPIRICEGEFAWLPKGHGQRRFKIRPWANPKLDLAVWKAPR